MPTRDPHWSPSRRRNPCRSRRPLPRGRQGGRLHSLGRGLHLLVLPCVLALWLAASSCSVNPATGQRQLSLIGENQEIALGRQSDEQIVQSMGLVEDDELQRYVDRLGQELAAVSERPDLPWTFRVVDEPVVNAFALPGGYIYVTRGILAHLNSEAELVGVLGHEIGHVTARHGVEQLSKAQLAQIGLGVGMIVSEDFRDFGSLASQGLGLLFLKFGRDDERQADDLGLRYVRRTGYEPREMVNVFDTLERVSQARDADRLPGWLSTHPAPENRIERLAQQISSTDPRGTVHRDAYLERLDGLIFGEDPRQGYFEDGVFYHPDMAFRMDFPRGWKAVNQRSAVQAVSPQDNAAVILSLAQGEDVRAASRDFFEASGVERVSAVRLSYGGLPAVADSFYASDGQTEYRGVAAFVEYGGRVFRILGFGTLAGYRDSVDSLERSVASFEPLRDRRYLDVEPRRLDLVRLPRDMSLEEFQRRYAPDATLEELALVNAVEVDVQLEGGRLMKRMVGGRGAP